MQCPFPYVSEICHEIQNLLGTKKIVECILVDIEFKCEPFVTKSLMCSSNLIDNNYLSKPWKRSYHFALFIKPKENGSVLLKEHCFNRTSECALALLYCLNDIGKYLDKWTNIVNGMSILDRIFTDMEMINFVYHTLGLLGIHILKSYHYLLIVKKTKYSTLIKAFLCFYHELTSVFASTLLQLEQYFNFVPHEIFKESLPDKVILDELINCWKQ